MDLTTLTIEELNALLQEIPEELRRRKQSIKDAKNARIVEFHLCTNELGRNIYTIKEIAQLVGVKEHVVANAIKEYNKGNR